MNHDDLAEMLNGFGRQLTMNGMLRVALIDETPSMAWTCERPDGSLAVIKLTPSQTGDVTRVEILGLVGRGYRADVGFLRELTAAANASAGGAFTVQLGLDGELAAGFRMMVLSDAFEADPRSGTMFVFMMAMQMAQDSKSLALRVHQRHGGISIIKSEVPHALACMHIEAMERAPG